MAAPMISEQDPAVAVRANNLYRSELSALNQRTDTMFVFLMLLQWIAAITVALWISPQTWAGTSTATHPHVWAAIVLGGIITLFPVSLVLLKTGTPLTRHIVAIGQMLWSALLIHLTGGRIESHFHVFGSLAFLTFYRDWRVLVTASAVVTLDHLLRGMYWPQSVYGILTSSLWRTMEHGFWVVFEDVFLLISIRQSLKQARKIATEQALLEKSYASEIATNQNDLERNYKLLETTNQSLQLEIGERQQIEHALRGSEERYRRIVEFSPFAIFICKQSVVTFVNRPGLELFKADTPEQILGKSPFDLIDPAFHPLIRERQRQILELGQAVPTIEQKILCLDGTAKDVESTAFPFVEDGETCIQVFLHDVSERKRLETQERQAQRMEITGQLAGGVAHDFNNLLTVILGYCEFLKDDPALTGHSREMAEQIHQAGNRAATLTRQLLAFSRQQVLQPRVLNLNDIVLETSKMLDRLIGEDVTLTTSLSSRLWSVKVDAGQMEQVLMNLAVNARDAMPQGGKLTIETGNTELDETYARTHEGVNPGDYVVLTVSDTGCGMDEKTQARIFEPFFTTKPVGKGTGLGLATVFGIVKQSGGHVTVYSEPGQGSAFRVYLPRVEVASPDNRRDKPKHAAPSGTETVVVVEDERMVRNIACHVLRSQGYTVLEAQNGAEALMTIAQHEGPVDLVLTDVVMPEMSGRQLSERLLAMQPGLNVLFMSGYTDDAIVRHGVLDAETNFIQKPFTHASLAQKVRDVLDRRSSQMPSAICKRPDAERSQPIPQAVTETRLRICET